MKLLWRLALVTCIINTHTTPHALDDRDTMIIKTLNNNMLYAPWRSTYFDPTNNNSCKKNQKQCPFCAQISAYDDEKYLVLKRGMHCVVMLNLFPYTAGHLLIIPYKHCGQLHNICAEAYTEMMQFAAHAIKLFQEKFGYEGANIGFNIGTCAGASIPDHLHMHVVPRTQSNQAFITLLANTPVIGVDLHDMYNKLKVLL